LCLGLITPGDFASQTIRATAGPLGWSLASARHTREHTGSGSNVYRTARTTRPPAAPPRTCLVTARRKSVPRSRTQLMIRDYGRFVPEEQPEALASALLTFLQPDAGRCVS
jgi:hypothetical protein